MVKFLATHKKGRPPFDFLAVLGQHIRRAESAREETSGVALGLASSRFMSNGMMHSVSPTGFIIILGELQSLQIADAGACCAPGDPDSSTQGNRRRKLRVTRFSVVIGSIKFRIAAAAGSLGSGPSM
ncbi:hypothetical protein MLD38_036419 [Melastoma candidum]|uniref:Uncharacterized protein n=1 Tax=Melastoma candidum TaxID=119954 RepID=A0ACB9LJW4_9MYRT|nr:hypothetical protein MLD38_036419 [Melastoma candidum]